MRRTVSLTSASAVSNANGSSAFGREERGQVRLTPSCPRLLVHACIGGGAGEASCLPLSSCTPWVRGQTRLGLPPVLVRAFNQTRRGGGKVRGTTCRRWAQADHRRRRWILLLR